MKKLFSMVLMTIALANPIFGMQEDKTKIALDNRDFLEAIFNAIQEQDCQTIESLLKRESEPNKTILNERIYGLTPSGGTLLSIVLARYHDNPHDTFYPKLIDLLIHYGAKVVQNFHVHRPLSPLHYAAINGNINGVKCLLKNAIQLNWPSIKPIFVGYFKQDDCVLQKLPPELLYMLVGYCSKKEESIKNLTYLLTFNGSNSCPTTSTPYHSWKDYDLGIHYHYLTDQERKELEQILDPNNIDETYKQLKKELMADKATQKKSY